MFDETGEPIEQQTPPEPTSIAPTHLELPNRKKGWKGGPDAEIEVKPVKGGFVVRHGVQTPTGGYATPFQHSKVYKTREDAIRHGVAEIRKYAESKDVGHKEPGEPKARKRIIDWLDTVTPQNEDITAQPRASGMSRPGDLKAAIDSPKGAGVVATELSGNAQNQIVEAVANGKAVFVDSGAFSLKAR
jgi:hypothetical protein